MAKKDPKKSHTRPHLTLGIDLGGTKILAAVVDETGHIIGTSKRKTRAERGVDEVIERIAKTAIEAVEDARLDLSTIEAVGTRRAGCRRSSHRRARIRAQSARLAEYSRWGRGWNSC